MLVEGIRYHQEAMIMLMINKMIKNSKVLLKAILIQFNINQISFRAIFPVQRLVQAD